VSGPRNFELAADIPDGAFLHFAVPGHGSDFTIGRILPKSVIPSLPLKVTTMVPQMLLQVVELHAGVS
jgi:hypothetical protein